LSDGVFTVVRASQGALDRHFLGKIPAENPVRRLPLRVGFFCFDRRLAFGRSAALPCSGLSGTDTHWQAVPVAEGCRRGHPGGTVPKGANHRDFVHCFFSYLPVKGVEKISRLCYIIEINSATTIT
jgi:hypothetical protein